jgi:hypothetical protein
VTDRTPPNQHDPRRRECRCRDCCIDRAAQQYIDGLADRDQLTAEDAARAAGARTPDEISGLAARIRQARTGIETEDVALDPDSDAGRRLADAISDFEAEVITRLRREGKPVPDLHSPDPREENQTP